MTTISDFNTKSKNWYSQVKSSFEGKTIKSITSQFELYQLINETTNSLENCSLCIDLIFTSQPNLVVEPGVHPSLLQDKNELYQDFRRGNTNTQLLNKLNHLQKQLNVLINKSKQYYYARMTKKIN